MKKNVLQFGLAAILLVALLAVASPGLQARETAHRYGRHDGPPPAVHRHHPPRPYPGPVYGPVYGRPYVRPHYYAPRPTIIVHPYSVARPVIGVYF